ncbi:transcriptional attenuator, LytR family [Gracilibacillus ureilyticus]|uniref:Regulatory protein MsrR n=1 Tax=Gracilibacillus ureilyticus TaxID=531814 RepID=A0A1H9UFP1_9BACI|nr:LCP family protein [Gracilibacillus ureilyticus]SES07987.1 transcriptional attenuator, LytR family [Gracilibacillus ureilyticus]
MAEGKRVIIKRKRKKKRKRKLFLFVILLLFAVAVAYSVFQYWEGKKAAEDKINNPERDQEMEEYANDFEASEPVDGKVNVLLLGEDSDEYGISRTDTIMIAQYDADNDRAKLVSIMRDTYVNIPDYGYNKINVAYANGGPELLRKTIKENFDIDIHNYAIVNFEGFAHIVDTIAPDGIEIDVEKQMNYTDNAGGLRIDLEPGVQNLTGEELLGYARFRHDGESDFGRVRRQQQVMSVLKDELLSFSSIIKIPKVVGTLIPYVNTNMSETDIGRYAVSFLTDTPKEIETLRIPVELPNSYWPVTHSHAGEVLEIDEAMNRQALEDFLERGINPLEEQSGETESGEQQ